MLIASSACIEVNKVRGVQTITEHFTFGQLHHCPLFMHQPLPKETDLARTCSEYVAFHFFALK